MTKMSNYLETALVNVTLRGTAYTAPTTVYLALYTTDPTDADTGTEVTGGSYARQAMTFAAPSDGATSLSTNVTFPQATAGWGTVTHVGIRDAVTGGNLLYYTPMTTARAILTGDTVAFLTGQIPVTLS